MRRKGKHVALLLVEGETEEVFFKRLAKNKLDGIPKHILNMKGNYNINNKIVDRSTQFSNAHPNDTFDVYVCVDRERLGMPIYNRARVDEKVNALRGFETKIDIIAELMIESLFFIDIDNIYIYLRTPKKQRSPAKYNNFRKFTHKDLSKLFASSGKQYFKGFRCEPLVCALNLDLLVSKAAELELLVTNIVARHNELNV